jgi:hypothetical protein
MIYVRDDTPPTISGCSEDRILVKTTDPGLPTYTPANDITFPNVFGKDNIKVELEYWSPALSTNFTLGFSNLTYVVFDTSGNSDRCVQQVRASTLVCQSLHSLLIYCIPSFLTFYQVGAITLAPFLSVTRLCNQTLTIHALHSFVSQLCVIDQETPTSD